MSAAVTPTLEAPHASPPATPPATKAARRRAWILGSAGLLALFAQQDWDAGNGSRGLVLYAIAAVLFAAALKHTKRDRVEAHAPTVFAWPNEARQALIAAGLVMGLLFFTVDTENLTNTTWIIQAAGIALVIATGHFADKNASYPLPLPRSPIELTTATTQVILLGVVLLGAWVRFRNIGELPRGFWVDEADVGLVARRITDEGYRPIFADPVPAYHAYLVAISSAIFGEGITAVRAVSAITGTATILAGYLAGREMFGKMAGLILASFVAFSRWNITLSRVGMNNVMLPLFAFLTLGLLLRGRRRQSHMDYALAGVSAGAGMLFYSAIASSLVAFGVLAIFVAWTGKQNVRSFGTQVFIAAVAVLAVMIPLLKFMDQDSDRYFARNRTTALWSPAGRLAHPTVWEGFKENLRRYLPMAHYDGDRNGRHNVPGEPMLSPLVGGLSIMGLGATLFRTDRWLTVLALVWVPMALAPGVLSLPWEAPNSLRAVAVQPVAFMLAAGAVYVLASTLVTTKYLKYGMLSLLAAAIGIGGFASVNQYFDANRERSDIWAIHSTAETIVAGLTADAPESSHVQAVAFLRNGKVQQFLSPDDQFDAIFGTDMQLPFYVPQGQDALMFAMNDSFDIGTQAQVLYPNAQVQREVDGQQPDLIIIRIPADDLSASFGWTQTTDTTFEAALLVDINDSYRFRLAAQSDTELVVNGRTLGTCAAANMIPLAAGVHLMTVDSTDGSPPMLEWEREGQSGWEPVPNDRLVQRSYVPGGLVARHFADAASDEPTFYEIDSTINLRMHEFVVPRPYRTEWTGTLLVPAPGDYELFLRTDDPGEVRVNGTPVVSTGADFADASAVVTFDEGPASISVGYDDTDGRSQILLRWRPVGSDAEPAPIPSDLLVPWTEPAPAVPCP